MKSLLFLLGTAKFGKVFATGGTMLVAVFAYGQVFGWPYAVGLVALLFAHEMDHYMAARRGSARIRLSESVQRRREEVATAPAAQTAKAAHRCRGRHGAA